MPGLLCGGVFVLVLVLIRWASVLLLLNAIFIPVFLSRLVTFLICGDEKVNVAHFSFLVGSVGWLFLAICRIVCHSLSPLSIT